MFMQRIIVKNVFFRKFNINSSVLLPHSVVYHWIGFSSGYLMILTSNVYYKYHILYCQKNGSCLMQPLRGVV